MNMSNALTSDETSPHEWTWTRSGYVVNCNTSLLPKWMHDNGWANATHAFTYNSFLIDMDATHGSHVSGFMISDMMPLFHDIVKIDHLIISDGRSSRTIASTFESAPFHIGDWSSYYAFDHYGMDKSYIVGVGYEDGEVSLNTE